MTEVTSSKGTLCLYGHCTALLLWGLKIAHAIALQAGARLRAAELLEFQVKHGGMSMLQMQQYLRLQAHIMPRQIQQEPAVLSPPQSFLHSHLRPLATDAQPVTS